MFILLGAAAVSGTGAATIGTGLTQPSASGLLAGTLLPPTHHRRLLGHIFTTNTALKTAVQAYSIDVASAVATYGPIADWDVSAITDMSSLFWSLSNADISSWDTSSVTTMYRMFGVRKRSSPWPAPNLQSSLPLHAACTAIARRPAAFPGPHLAPPRIPSFRLGRARLRSTSR